MSNDKANGSVMPGNGLPAGQGQAISPGTQKATSALSKPAKPILQAKNGKFLKGTAPGPGYPKGRPMKRDFFKELCQELGIVEERERKTFMKHRWQRAFKSDSVAADMMAYLLPKQKPSEQVDVPDLTFTNPMQVNVFPNANVSFAPPTNGHA